MTTRTYTQKDGTIWEWKETPEVSDITQQLNNFIENYQEPLYTAHPNLKKDDKN